MESEGTKEFTVSLDFREKAAALCRACEIFWVLPCHIWPSWKAKLEPFSAYLCH